MRRATVGPPGPVVTVSPLTTATSNRPTLAGDDPALVGPTHGLIASTYFLLDWQRPCQRLDHKV